METGIVLVGASLFVAWIIFWTGYAAMGGGAGAFAFGMFMAMGFPPLLLGLVLIVANV